MPSRFRVALGEQECGNQSQWLRSAVYMHDGHKVTARFPFSRAQNMGHWMTDVTHPLLAAVVTLGSFVPDAVVLDAAPGALDAAMNVADIVAGLFANASRHPVALVQASSLPEVVCVRRLLIPDNTVEMRLSDGRPPPTYDGLGNRQEWAASFGQPGPPVHLAQRAVNLFRLAAFGRCGIRPKATECVRKVAVYARNRTQRRSISNSGELAAELRKAGFEVVTGFEFYGMSFCDMVRFMSSIDAFVTIAGTGMGSNAYYMQPSAILFEVIPKVSFKRILGTPEQKLYGQPGHWSESCPTDYWTSLGHIQLAGLNYSCFPAKADEVLPPKKVKKNVKKKVNGIVKFVGPENTHCSICVSCAVEKLKKLNSVRSRSLDYVCS